MTKIKKIKGEMLSSGSAKGITLVVKNKKDLSKIRKGNIVVCEYTTPEHTPYILLASGIIVEKGGNLSHTAIFSRELGIPCLLIEKARKKISNAVFCEIKDNLAFLYQ